MLRSYHFVVTDHQKLHGYVLEFFNSIESLTKDYEAAGSSIDDFYTENFNVEFLPIVKAHHKILKAPFYEIYTELRQWSQEERTELCEQIRLSNDIERICAGGFIPPVYDLGSRGVHGKIRGLFIKLYENVLGGNPIYKNLGLKLRGHFDEFRKQNFDTTLCPMCGISELKTQYDAARDPYDHYLPKSLYPFSSVNFCNLIPTCTDCNSTMVKGDKDIVALATGGKLFYPYDPNHRGIETRFSITADASEFEDIDWSVSFTNPDGKVDEVASWMTIYNIEERYLAFVKGRIKKWYETYWVAFKKLTTIPEEERLNCYLISIEADEKQFLSVIRKPALEEFMNTSAIAKAEQEALRYQ